MISPWLAEDSSPTLLICTQFLHAHMIQTVETNVMVLAVAAAQGLKAEMRFGWHLVLERVYDT